MKPIVSCAASPFLPKPQPRPKLNPQLECRPQLTQALPMTRYTMSILLIVMIVKDMTYSMVPLVRATPPHFRTSRCCRARSRSRAVQ